jgi:hypothetical protein
MRHEREEDHTAAPYEGILHLLMNDSWSPQEAADALKPLIGYAWDLPHAIPDAAPIVLQRLWDEQAWRRFGADRPVALQLAGVHFLFRAAASLGDLEDTEASLVLFGAAKKGLREVLLAWLGGRECRHCIELRQKLERYSP